MRTIIAPEMYELLPSCSPTPGEGPLCFHGEPTVLRALNGRNVYVCARYPRHHCRACCPLDVMLLEEAEPRGADDASAPFGSPLQTSFPMAESGSPITMTEPSAAREIQARETQPHSPSDSMPASTVDTPQMPPAPTKPASHGSVSSRAAAAGSAAARSLTPIFNGFKPAVMRASQLGGRFATLRANASNIAKMQRQVSSGAMDISNTLEFGRSFTEKDENLALASNRKRARNDGPTTESDGVPSLRTVSISKEPRLTPWPRNTRD